MKREESRAADFLHATRELLARLDLQRIARAKQLLLECHARRGRIYTLGNGGSASTAQHFACDLAKYASADAPHPFDARCLTDNTALYTAWANDAAREDVFVNLLRGCLGPNDVLVAISVHGGKGFSTDLVRAVRFAREVGAQTIALVGFDGGLLHAECDCSILVPADSTPQTEAIHLVIQHCLVQLIREDLAAAVPSSSLLGSNPPQGGATNK